MTVTAIMTPSASSINSSTTYSDKLQFSFDQQSAVIGWMLKNYEFCLKCFSALKPDLFGTPALGLIFKSIEEFVKEYKQQPSPENLFDFINIKPNMGHIKHIIHDCMAWSIKYNQNYLRDRLEDWVKTSLFLQHTEEARRFTRLGDVHSMEQTVRQFLQKSGEYSFKMNGAANFDSPLDDFIKRFKTDVVEGMTTGMPEFDVCLGGSLRRGEHTVLLAPLGSGKTTSCINFLYHNVLKKKHCLFLTHEEPELVIKCKIRQRFLMKNQNWLLNIIESRSPLDMQILETSNKMIQQYLTYYSYNKAGGLFVENIIDIIRMENEKLFAKIGKYYDLVIDDYPGKLSSKVMNNFKEYRHSTKYCYDSMQQLALEYNYHAISPVQCNRAGVKQNKNRDDDEYLSAADMAESLGIAQDASNIIAINRSSKDERKNRMFFNIIKSRGSSTDDVIMTFTDFSQCITHDPSLGGQVVPKAQDRQSVDVLAKIRGDNNGKSTTVTATTTSSE